MKKISVLLVLIILICAGVWFFTPKTIPPAKDYNILYITSESFKPGHLGCYGYDKNTSPFIDELAKKGVLFKQMIHHSGWTNENLMSNFTSLEPPIHGVITRQRSVDPSWETPLEILSDYYNYSIPKMEGWQNDPNHDNVGFEKWQGHTTPIDWLKKNRDKKFFLFYHYLYTHLPYNAKDEFKYKFFNESMFKSEEQKERIENSVMKNVIIPRNSLEFKPEDIPIINALYDGEILGFDHAVQELIGTLKELHLFDKTIIIIGADHGDEIFEHGWVGHASTSKYGTLYDELIHVPFIIIFPKELPSGKVISSQIRGIDVMPTVFDLLGLPVPAYFRGKSLVPLMKGEEPEKDRIAFCRTSRAGYGEPDPKNVTDYIIAVRTGTWKLIHFFYKEYQNKFELYNLKDDPGEKNDVKDRYPKILAELKNKLVQWLNECSQVKPQKIDYRSTYQKLKESFKTKKIDYSNVPSPPVIENLKKENIIKWKEVNGTVSIKWSGRSDVPYVIGYKAGKGNYFLEGEFQNEGNIKVYGPFKEDYWKENLIKYNPFLLRISIDKEPREWSSWIKITLE